MAQASAIADALMASRLQALKQSLSLDDSFFDKQTVTIPPPKEQPTIRFDRDIVAWFRGQGRGYQTRMNAVLRAYVDTQKRRTQRQARK